jgi:hypothetical protein
MAITLLSLVFVFLAWTFILTIAIKACWARRGSGYAKELARANSRFWPHVRRV